MHACIGQANGVVISCKFPRKAATRKKPVKAATEIASVEC